MQILELNMIFNYLMSSQVNLTSSNSIIKSKIH